MLFFNAHVREEYASKHSPHDSDLRQYPLIKPNDVAYTLHGLACVVTVFFQAHFLDYKQTRAQQHLSVYTRVLLYSVIAFCSAMVLGAVLIPTSMPLQLLDVAEILGTVKVCMSISKYIPQLIHNHRRKSTKGWAMNAMALDIIGGLSSLGQLFLDGYINHDVGAVWGNTSKLALAIVTMSFDMMFMFQHYVLFPKYQPEVISLDDFK